MKQRHVTNGARSIVIEDRTMPHGIIYASPYVYWTESHQSGGIFRAKSDAIVQLDEWGNAEQANENYFEVRIIRLGSAAAELGSPRFHHSLSGSSVDSCTICKLVNPPGIIYHDCGYGP